MLYKNSKLGAWLAANHPEAKSWARGLEQILTGHEQILDHYEQKIVGYQAIPTGENDEDGNPLFTQGDPIYGDDHERPVYRDGEPIYEYGAEQFELVGWQDEWGTPPTEEELGAFAPPPPESNPVTDVNSPVKAILTGYQESEAARAQRIALLKSSASYALGTKIAGDLAAANPPSNADELAALKAEAKSQASSLGGAFFDSYFAWIGAYREGGGPGFLAAVQGDTATAFLDWPTPANGITIPDGTIVLPEGGVIRDLFQYFLA